MTSSIGARDRVSSAFPYVIDRLTDVLTAGVEALRGVLRQRFESLDVGELGRGPQRVARLLFDQWCRQSGIVPPSRGVAMLVAAHGEGERAEGLRRLVHNDLGFPTAEATTAVDTFLALLGSGEQAERAAARVVWELYAEARETFYAQTAHVLLGRLLLYRVGEDGGIFPELISGEQLRAMLSAARQGLVGSARPSLRRLLQLMGDLEGSLPIVYQRGTLDWWVIDEAHERLTDRQRARLAIADNNLDAAVAEVLERLDTFN